MARSNSGDPTAIRRGPDIMLGATLRERIGPSGLRSAASRGEVHQLWHGAYALRTEARDLPLETRLAAADLTLGRVLTPCLDTAAALHGFDISGDGRLHLIADRDTTSRRAEWVMHRIEPVEPEVIVGGRVTMHPVETAVRVAARRNSKAWSLAVLDAALRSGVVTGVDELRTLANRLRINGVRNVREVAPWASGLAESPRESLLRWILHESGLPCTIPQWRVQHPSGRRYRLDLAWPEYKVACEYEGQSFHTGEALWRDRRRLNDLQDLGWSVLFVTSAMLSAGQREMIERARAVLRSRGARL
jgi:very-short-patch-repair endonuclease